MASSTERPRAADNARMHSILAAAIGLSSLGSPSASESDLKAAGIKATENAATKPSPQTITPRLNRPVMMTIPQSTETMTMAPHSHYLKNMPSYENLASYAALAARAGARPFTLEKPMPWSSMHEVPSYEAPRVNAPFIPHRATSGAALAMDRFSMLDRVAASARPSYPYSTPYPTYNSGSLSLPTSLQTMPVTNTKNFPETLFDIISMPEHAHIISWMPHGKSFIIHDKHLFAAMILPRYFDGAKFTSFTRRLKRWSFVRSPRGPELGAYSNPYFARDDPELVEKMRYRMEGKFGEAKRKMEEKESTETETDMLKEQTAKEVEAKVQELKKKEDQTKVSPILTSQKGAVKIPSPDIPQDRPITLPSASPKKTKALKKNVKNMAPIEILRNHLSDNEFVRNMQGGSAEVPREQPTLISPNDSHERRLKEIQQQLILAQSILSQDAAAGTRSSAFRTTNSRSIPRSMPNHLYATLNANAQNKIAGRMHEAERIDAYHRCGDNTIPLHQETMASKTRALPKAKEYVRGMRSRMAPSFIQTSGSNDGAGRPVMLSRHEEEEFARFLFLKRKAGV
ncbi:hypothetical protein ACHAXR_003498 [Thalassiosira sp. AJA248-18]